MSFAEILLASFRKHRGKLRIELRISSVGPFLVNALISLSVNGNVACLAHALKNSVAVENGPPSPGIGPTSKELSLRLTMVPILGSLIEAKCT